MTEPDQTPKRQWRKQVLVYGTLIGRGTVDELPLLFSTEEMADRALERLNALEADLCSMEAKLARYERAEPWILEWAHTMLGPRYYEVREAIIRQALEAESSEAGASR